MGYPQKILVTIILFYFFALLQSSFFSYFSIFGVVPNLVFIFFFLLVFSVKKNKNYPVILPAIMAGIFLDVFSYSYLGPSVVLLLALGFLLKKIQTLLKNRDDNYSFVYFAPLFLIFFIVYSTLSMVYLRFFDASHVLMIFDFKFLAGIVYNLVFASLFFYIYKKWGKFIG